MLWQRTAVAVAGIGLTAALLALAFAGSATKLPEGVQIANVDVGGMTAAAGGVIAVEQAGAGDGRSRRRGRLLVVTRDQDMRGTRPEGGEALGGDGDSGKHP